MRGPRPFAVLFALALVPSFVAVPAAARRHVAPSPTPTPEPSPTPSPTPLPENVRVDQLRTEIGSLAHAAPGRLGVAIVDIVNGVHIAVRGDDAFPISSVAKIPIALAVYRRADQRRLDLDDIVDPGGVPRTVAASVAGMLLGTDARATRTLLAELGGTGAVDTMVARLGIVGIDLTAGKASPNSIADLLGGIAQQHFAHLDSTNELLELLGKVRAGADLFPAGLPDEAALAHEPGWSATVDGITTATNDAGILTLPDGRRIVVVAMLADSHADQRTRDAVLASVARAVYATYSP